MGKKSELKKAQHDPKIIEKVIHSIHIAEAMNECLWLGDKNHKTIYVNPVYEETSGYSLEECIGKPSDFCFDEKSKKLISEHHRLRKNGMASQYEAIMVSKKGKKIPLLVSGAPTSEGGSIGIFINLTKIKKLHQEKLISEQIVKNSTEAIVTLDKKRKIKMWNAGATKIFGYKENEVLNKKLTILIPPEERETNIKLIDEVEKNKYIKNFETVRLTKDGNLIDVSLSITKVTDENSKFIGYLVIYRDITERKKINTELQKRFEAIQDAYKELGLQKRQADYIYEIIDLAVSNNSLETLSKLIVSATCMLTKCDGTVLRLFDEDKKILQIKTCMGVSCKWLDKNKINLKNSLAESAYKNRRPIIVQDVARSQRHKGTNLVKAHGFTTLILIPLIVEDKFIGTLSLYSTDPAKFRLIENDFLERFGKQCSMALYIKKIKQNSINFERSQKDLKLPSSASIKDFESLKPL